MKVLLIVPAYNEEENIVRVCNNLRENFSQYDFVVINEMCIRDRFIMFLERFAYRERFFLIRRKE